MKRERSTRRGCRSPSAATACARTASSRPRAGARRAGRPPRSSPRSSALAGDGVREVTLLGQNVNSYGRDLPKDAKIDVRRAAGHGGRDRGHRARPLHEPAPEGHARGRDPRARRAAERCASTSTCRCSRARAAILKAMRRTYNRERYLDRVALIREHVPDMRDHDRHHRRLPRRDRGGLRARRSRWWSEVRYDSAFTFIFSPRRGTEAAELADQLPHAVKRERMERLVEVVQRRAPERAQRFVGARWRCWWRARRAPTRRGSAAASATTRP